MATALSDSGFAHHIRTAVAHSTGVAILALEKQGLVHDRRFVASNDFLIARPVERPVPVKGRKKPPPPKDPLGLIGVRSHLLRGPASSARPLVMRVVTACPPAMGHHVPPLTRHPQENP